MDYTDRPCKKFPPSLAFSIAEASYGAAGSAFACQPGLKTRPPHFS
jgi:hypothetical protein